jgi:translocation and assembly module TamB
MRKFLTSSLRAAVIGLSLGFTLGPAPLLAQEAAQGAQQQNPQETAQEREDRGYLAGLLEDNLSGAGRHIIIEGFSGALSSRASIERLTIADEQGVWLTLNKIVLDWNRSALLSGKVEVNELRAEEIILARLPQAEATVEAPSPEASPFALPELPVSVNIGQLAANRIELGEAVLGEVLVGRLQAQASLSGGEGQIALLFERTDGGAAGLLSLSGSFANDTRQLALALEAREGAGGVGSRLMGLPGTPAIELSIKGMGPLDDFDAVMDLSSDGHKRLSGTFTMDGSQDGAHGFRRCAAP